MKATMMILPALAICLMTIALSEGMPRARTRDLRCQCIVTESRTILHRLFLNIDLIPKGPHCKNVEVIATLKNGQEVCLEPTAPWVKRIIDRILGSVKPTPSTR